MKKNILSGILYSATGSMWWGIIGVFYFKYVAFAGAVELLVHRTVWTFFVLILSIAYFKKWKSVCIIFNQRIKFFVLIITGILIFINWSTWIYAVTVNKLVDASFGYYIFPIISVFFGIVFFKEEINKKRIISIVLVIISIIFLLLTYKEIPWIGLIVAFTWSLYNLLRKKISVETDIGLFIETLFIAPVAIIIFYFIYINGHNDFTFNDLNLAFLLFLAGPVTVIPLYLYVRGVELSGLGTSGMIFFITPSCQFLLGVFYYNEILSIYKLIGFIFIWIAVIIYLFDIKNKNGNMK